MDFPIFIFSLTFLYFLHHSQATNHFHFDNSTDEEALISFKSSIKSDPYGVLDSWHPNNSFCSWYGVQCNLKKQRVIGLNLTDCSLAGTLTSHITNLSFLQVLDLENNSFTGEIPIEIHRLFRLRVLNLYYNHINGTIPSSLSACSNLQIINLVNNQLQGTIPLEIGSLFKLQDLRLSVNTLSGVIPSSFGNLSSLKNLYLTYNHISGSIPSELGRLSNLLHLQLGANTITGKIPTEIFNISSLIKLEMAGNEISGNLPANLFTMLPNLLTVFLGGNKLHGHIPISLSNASNLEKLDLSISQFSGKIPLLWKLQKINLFNVENNQLISGGVEGLDFIISLTNSTDLEVFSIDQNLFTGQLPSSIGNLSKHLTEFLVGRNQLSGNIPEELGNLGGLQSLGLESNFFSGKIPSSIGKLKNIQQLLMGRNRLSGSIPQMLGNLSQLFKLALQGNNFSGTIPSSLSNCQHLNLLTLAGNQLNGSIPKEILNLPSLTFFYISSNYLSGSLPSEIGKLTMVQTLYVSKNMFSGVIPSTIEDCSSLVYLDMSENSFQGPIPNSLAKIKGIEHIDLSSNKFSGKIPELDSLHFLEYLNLSFNMLEGEVPKYGIFLNTSAVFLSGNLELCGGIDKLGLPKCIAENNHSNGKNKTKKLVIGLVAGVFFVSIVILTSFLLILRKKRRNRHESAGTNVISFEGTHKRYSYYELKSGTRNFSDENLIGKGSFGSVYKGVMRDGASVAVKVLNLDQHGANKSFLAECEAFRNIRHRNLLKVLSACSSPNFKALVLQFMPNGNLESWLHKQQEEDGAKQKLSLKQRIDIAIDIASALAYLHHECETPFVHCDLKPSNVLLDENMTAHVGDFGLVRMLQVQGNSTNHLEESTIGLKGTIGYIAPEYGFGNGVSTKGDVYSFGILLLEMFTGRRPTQEMFNENLNLQMWIATSLPDMVMRILDEEIQESLQIQNEDHLISIINIGLKCTNASPEERPDMIIVLSSINKVRAVMFGELSSNGNTRR